MFYKTNVAGVYLEYFSNILLGESDEKLTAKDECRQNFSEKYRIVYNKGKEENDA